MPGCAPIHYCSPLGSPSTSKLLNVFLYNVQLFAITARRSLALQNTLKQLPVLKIKQLSKT